MSCLYIGGAQCIHSEFKNQDDWKKFDSLREELSEVAQECGVDISRYCLDEGDYSFVIVNKRASHQCFYENAAFDYNMSVEVSDTFAKRAEKFIDKINELPQFKAFHCLEWSEPQVLYFVTS